MKSILIAICILFAGAAVGAAQTKEGLAAQKAFDECVAKYGFSPCEAALMRNANKVAETLADQFDGGAGKRQRFIDKMNEGAKVDKMLGRGLMLDWIVIAYGERKTIADLPPQVRNPDSAEFAGLKKGLTALGFKGSVAMTTSGECLVIPFAEGAESRIEKCSQINFLTIDDQ